MHQVGNKKSTDYRQDTFNPLAKSLSNSNLNLIESQTSSLKDNNKYIHSAMNLLDLTNEEYTPTPKSDLNSQPTLLPPRRPPPPVPSKIKSELENSKLVDFETDFTRNKSNTELFPSVLLPPLFPIQLENNASSDFFQENKGTITIKNE
jgi:hypothetical protein